MTIELSPFDAAEYIETNEDAAVFLNQSGIHRSRRRSDRPCKRK